MVGLASALLVATPAAAAGRRPVTSEKLIRASRTFRGDVRALPPAPRPPERERPEREPPLTPLQPGGRSAPIGAGTLPGLQPLAPAPLSSFEGLHYGEDCGGVQCGDGHPPDTNGDVGPAYFVQSVNTAVGIYDKSTGARVAGFSLNALMSEGSFGNLCDTDNFGDPVVLYDSFHDRWLITDFAFQLDSSGNVKSPPGSYQCFAVSRTGDPVSGGWSFYSLHISDYLQDYPKFGVWPDGLYMSANMFDFSANGSFKDVRVWALNLAQMEAGNATAQTVSFDAPARIQGVSVFSLLPSNARVQAGTPPADRSNFFTSVWGWTDRVRVWAFHVDWTNTAASTFTGPTDSSTGSVWGAPPDTVPSKNGNGLDTLAMRLMMQNQYTNRAGVESLWDSHTVQGSSSSQSAVRWYQVPVTGGTVGSALQASTWNPDSSNRFIPSLAVDRAGDMAIGYSVSSASLYPAIRYAGRLAGDPANALGQSEASMLEGMGSQTGNCGGSACTRWGDYSAMALDPDGCTFWDTNEYYAASGLDDHTRIGSFALPGCTPIAMGALQGTVTDASSGNPISGAIVTAGIQSTTTDSSGAYSFPKIPAGSYGVTVNGSGYATGTATDVVVSSGGTTSRDFALIPSGATKLVFTSNTSSVASGSTKTLTVEVRDASDNLVSSDNSTVVTFAQTSGSGSVTGLGAATASGGVASKTVTGATAGPVTVQATASGLASATSSFSVTPGPAARLVFTSSTASVASGATKTLTVEVRDASDNLVSSDNSTVVTFAQTSGSGSVTGLGAATASGGVASKTVTGATAGPVTVQATASGLASATSSFSVTPGPAARLVFTSSTASVASGATKTLTVEVRDASDNLVSSDNSTVVTFAQTSGSGSVTGLGAATASGGVASKTVTGATAGPVTVQATASGLTSDTSSFNVTAAATHMAFTSATSDLGSGSTRALRVEVLDGNGDRVTSSSAPVTLWEDSGTGTLEGLPATVNAVDGVATVSVTGVRAGPITIEASSSGLAPATTSFSIVPGAVDHLVFLRDATNLASGSSDDLTVELRDANDNPVSSSGAAVAFRQTSGSGAVAGLGSSDAVAGVATKRITGLAAGPVTIEASTSGAAPASTSLTVVPGPPDHLSFTSATTDLASGARRGLIVEVRDANQNRVTWSVATLSFTKSAGEGTVTGLPATVEAIGGVASTNVTGFLAGPIKIAASASGIAGGTTSFDIAPGPTRRSVALKLAGRTLSGKVTTRSKRPACTAHVPVRLEMKSPGSKRWRTLTRLRTTHQGSFKKRTTRAATYRAIAPERPGCAKAISKALRVTRLR